MHHVAFVPRRVCGSLAACVVALVAGGCVFEDGAPDGAVILCAGDADCPSGSRCAVASHVCAQPGEVVDVVAPALVEARFDRRFVSEGAVTLTVSADEALGAPPVLSWHGDDPGFALVDFAGTDAHFTLADAAALPDGVSFTLASVTLEDAVHNSAERAAPVDAVLLVDRTPPVIADLRAEHDDPAAAALPFSAQPGTDVVEISFLVGEDVEPADATVALGTCAVSSVPPSGGRFAFTAAITGGCTTNGQADVIVTVHDRAGNVASDAARIDVDLAAPAASAVITVRRPGSSEPVAGALAGTDVVIDIASDEALAAAPDVAFDGAALALDPATVRIDEVTAARWTFHARVAAVGDGDSAAVHAGLVDLVGNASTVELGAVPLATAVESPCVDGGAGCVDFDGDSDPALSASCIGGRDVDDTDPLVHFGAEELPGDGLANDGGDGGDLPIDETTGVFVDFAAPAGGDGSRAAPLNDLAAAQQALGTRRWLFLRVGGPYPLDEELAASLLGGLDADWQRSALTNTPTAGSPADPSLSHVAYQAGSISMGARGGAQVLDGVDFDMVFDVFADSPLVVHRSNVHSGGTIDAQASVLASAAVFEKLGLSGNSGPSLLSGCDLGNTVTVTSGQLLVVGARPNDFETSGDFSVRAAAGSRVAVVNSVLGSVICDGCAALTVVHSTLFGQTNTSSVLSISAPASTALIVDDIFTFVDAPAVTSFIELSGVPDGGVSINNNLFDDVNVPLLAGDSFSAADAAALNACGPQCANAGGNFVAGPALAADKTHLTGVSPAAGAGTAVPGAPAAAAADVDGDCRHGDAVAVGPDEP